jgi:hypothetical protein
MMKVGMQHFELATSPAGDVAISASAFADPAPLLTRRNAWLRWLGPAISAALFVVVLHQLRTLDFATILAMVPRSIGFWAVFVLYYMAMPLTELVIFRRLWRIPWSGIFPLMRKMIGNEILLGYIGEVYFYSWARKRTDISAAPFGAIKDVAILSAVVGNVVTLAMLAIAYPLVGAWHLGVEARALYLSVATMLVTSLGLMLLRRRLFSLPARDLRFLATAHLIRIIGKMALAALLWHLALPAVALIWWFILSTLRQLLSRLPFVPNKDVAFAGLAVFLIGRDLEIGALMTMVASVTLAAHLIIGAALVLGEYGTSEARRCA